MKELIIQALQKRARKAISRYQPTIIAVTGSMGKTSTKNAIEVVLRESVSLRSAKKNFNNEIGVPLSILGEESPGRSPFKWLSLLFKPFVNDFPKVLLLEFGADRPGDIETLVELAPPTVGVVTGISTVHVENFRDVEELVNEKSKIIQSLPLDGLAVLNADDGRVMEMQQKTQAGVRTFGVRSLDVTVRGLSTAGRQDDHYAPGEQLALTTAEVVVDGAVVGELALKDMIGYAPIMWALAAIAVAERFEINPADAIDRLNRGMVATPGRLRPLAGIKGSLIIDDTYNAAPAAMRNGIDVLKLFTLSEERDRRIAALGSMAELGVHSEDEHRLIGMKVAEVADLFIAVGEQMQVAVNAAVEAGMNPEAVEWFATSEEAGRYLDRVIQEGDIVYVKGSQSSRMEKVVKDIMGEPLRASELLVRQEARWLE